MKLMDLIKDDFLINEKSKMIEKEIQKEIDELGTLTKQIEKLKKQLQPLQKKYGELIDDIIPVVEDLDDEVVITDKYVLQILKKGYTRETFQYKEGFLTSLDKVNENTKKILKTILDQTKKMTKINPNIKVRPLEGVGDTIKKWVNNFKSVIRKLTRNFKGIKDGNKQLRKLTR